VRVPVGDDAFPYVDRTDAFERRYSRHARYTPAKAGSDVVMRSVKASKSWMSHHDGRAGDQGSKARRRSRARSWQRCHPAAATV
jgi:hypothetical protein